MRGRVNHHNPETMKTKRILLINIAPLQIGDVECQDKMDFDHPSS